MNQNQTKTKRASGKTEKTGIKRPGHGTVGIVVRPLTASFYLEPPYRLERLRLANLGAQAQAAVGTPRGAKRCSEDRVGRWGVSLNKHREAH